MKSSRRIETVFAKTGAEKLARLSRLGISWNREAWIMGRESRRAVELGAEPVSARSADLLSPSKTPTSPDSVSPEKQGPTPRRRILIGAAVVIVLAAVLAFGVPQIVLAINTVSTDDAYVNGHVTFVAARVRGQVARVLVDDNNRVRRGDLLVQLDKEPFQVAVAQKKATVDVAQADLLAARAKARGLEAEARSRRWRLQHAMEDVDNQVAVLRARVAGLAKSHAELALAEVDFDRAAKLVTSDNIPRAEYDRRQANLLAARADVTAALADVHQIRVSLGLPAQPPGGDLDQVPPDLDQSFSSVLQAQADLIQSAAQLGVVRSYKETPNEMIEGFLKSDPQGDVDHTFDRLAAQSPDVKEAEAKLEAAERDLADAELDLRYTDVITEIDGVVTRRNVNPGNDVQIGQGLMAIRSLDEIWVDANFKETQLRDLRIGQPVDLYVDMYGDRQAFQGRISGFTMGTGSTLALLPAQNATGNFVKVVQRLPVRIDLVGYEPEKRPLFIGASVVPEVHVYQAPTGPDAGRLLQAYMPQQSTVDAAAAGSGAGK
jgi:membrane fusion protein, multidrug efflux system